MKIIFPSKIAILNPIKEDRNTKFVTSVLKLVKNKCVINRQNTKLIIFISVSFLEKANLQEKYNGNKNKEKLDINPKIPDLTELVRISL